MRVHHRHRAEQPLGVGVASEDVGSFGAGDQPLQCLGVALGSVDRPGLVAPLVDGEDEQPVGQLLVEFGGRGGHEQGDRAGDLVGVGHQASAERVLAGRGDRQASF